MAINSEAPGKQGHGAELNQKAGAAWGLTHPILLDESGAVGQAYGASNTPHVYVIDEAGALVYRGRSITRRWASRRAGRGSRIWRTRWRRWRAGWRWRSPRRGRGGVL
ncbi:MAG: hypothetical protein IPK80_30725 [Nannocystis sp.]|nr:hypothetical protein [Nannocystis sp.]